MKIALLILSLMANVAVAVVWVTKPRAESSPSATAAATTSPTVAATAKKETPASSSAVADLPASDLATLKTLGASMQVSGANLSNLVAQLRAQGFPPAMVKAIARAMLADQTRSKWRELQADDGGPFWQVPSYNRDPKRMAALRELNRDQTKQLKELIGADSIVDLSSDQLVAQQQRKWGNLPPEKMAKAEEIARDYSDLQQEVYMTAMGNANGGQLILLPEDREKLAYIAKQQHDDLAKVLSSQELLEYDLRTSPTANQLRNQLMGFDPTQDEFVALFKLQQGVDDKLGGSQFMTMDIYRQRQAALKELQPQVDELLGPERAAAYKQATDPQYQQVNRLVARLDLPATAATDVVSVQKDIQQRAVALRTNSSLSAADRTTQLNALAEEANGKISTALGGQRGLDAYKQYGGGWMQTLTRQGPVRPPTN